MNLSKSKYCMGIQCPKMLWLKENKPKVFDSGVLNETVLENGNQVGDLAMGLFGDFQEVPYHPDLDVMIQETQKLLEQKVPIICEASFSYKGLFCSVDILKNLGNKKVELYEVKSSTKTPEIYLFDISYQVYVLTQLGYRVEKACLVHINSDYVRKGPLDLQKFFKIEDFTVEAKEMGEGVKSNLCYLEEYLNQKEEPEHSLGLHCSSPYDCGFWNYCSREIPRPCVFDVRSLHAKKKFEYYERGIISFEDLQKAGVLNQNLSTQVDFELDQTGKEQIHKKEIQKVLSTLSYPLYFLDFETFAPAIPLYDDSRPYQQIPFQYSLHYIESEGGKLQHKEFLSEVGIDPRRGLAEHLCKDIPEDVCTTAYNMSFEKRVIGELAELYPDLSSHLLNIKDHIQDLMIPFKNKDYYNKAMAGSFSIKYVLPALFPGDPSLDYHNLEGIHNGEEASSTFLLMQSMKPEEIKICRKNLLKYCGLDTLAMVKIWEKLKEVSK